MSPEPSTPTRLMSVMALPRSPGVDQCADLVCDAEERVRLFARCGVPGFNLPALEPVQHLLQPDLDVLVLRTVAAKNRSGRRSEDQERQERERREQPHQPKGAARRGPQAEERCGTGDPLPAAVAHVRDQLDVAEAALERRDRKSTRLNSSHGSISYAVFCLKKKSETGTHATQRESRRG